MKLAGATVAVTGVTGFLGGYLVDVLLERGAHVVGVVRTPSKGAALAARGVELREADLADRAALAAGFAGADAVVSNAALVSLGGARPREVIETNVQGTRNIFEAVREAGVRRVVQVSSVAIYRAVHRPGAGRVDEDAPTHAHDLRITRFSAYGVSKARSEETAWELAGRHGIDLTTVRPTTIYGAGDPNFLPAFRKLMAPPISLRPLRTRLSLVYAGDVAEGIALALERDVAIGRAYNLAGSDDDELCSFVDAWKEAGERAPRWSVPVPIPIHLPWSADRARAELGWSPRPFADAVADTQRRERAAGA